MKYQNLTTRDARIEVFPTGLSAHWMRVVSNTDCVASAQLHYT